MPTISFPNISTIPNLVPPLDDIKGAFRNPFMLNSQNCADAGIGYPPVSKVAPVPDMPTAFGDYHNNMDKVYEPSWTIAHYTWAILIWSYASTMQQMWTRLQSLHSSNFAIPNTMPQMPPWPGMGSYSLSDLVTPHPGDLLDTINSQGFPYSSIRDLMPWQHFFCPVMKAYHALQVSALDYLEDVLLAIKQATNQVVAFINATIQPHPYLSLPLIPSAASLESTPVPSEHIVPDVWWPEFEKAFNIKSIIFTALGANITTTANFHSNLPYPIGNVFNQAAYPRISDLIGPYPTISPVTV